MRPQRERGGGMVRISADASRPPNIGRKLGWGWGGGDSRPAERSGRGGGGAGVGCVAVQARADCRPIESRRWSCTWAPSDVAYDLAPHVHGAQLPPGGSARRPCVYARPPRCQHTHITLPLVQSRGRLEHGCCSRSGAFDRTSPAVRGGGLSRKGGSSG